MSNAIENDATASAPTVSEFYFQYEILRDRPGLLGDIASLLGMLGFNILQLGGVSADSRGFLLQTDRPNSAQVLQTIIENMDDVQLTALRLPSLRDRIALRHGRFIERSDTETRTYRFVRDELGVLVDFLGELLKRPGPQVIGMRGQPRVGKTESIVAASVYANRRWAFVSSTLLKQTMLRDMPQDYWNGNFVYIIDGAVSVLRGDENHLQLVDEVLRLHPSPVVIEHPDIFLKHTRYGWKLFDCLLELRRDPDEEIQFEAYEQEAAQWRG